MLDPHLLNNELNIVALKLAKKNFKLDINFLKNHIENQKILQKKKEKLQTERNLNSKLISYLKFQGKNFDTFIKKIKFLKENINETKKELNNLQNSIKNYLVNLPNIPADEVPDGKNEKDNKEIYRWGKIRKYDFPIRNHIELGSILDGIDFLSAVKLTGSRFVVMKGQIALLHRALIQFMLDLHTEKHGYLEYYLPYLVNYNSMYCTGQLPKFSEDFFHLKPLREKKENKLFSLIPTAEVPLINLVRNEIIEENLLPLKMTSHTTCFRSEAGSYGKNNKGLIRQHQFDKVEIVQIVKPDKSMQALEEVTKHAEKVLQLLKLPYRKILLCTGDMSFSSCKTYDLEVWLPFKKNYQEISSCSNIGDFQARRMKTRYRSNLDKKLNLVHTLNGSGLAVGRTLVALLENNQISDGRIKIPSVLIPYMKGLNYIG